MDSEKAAKILDLLIRMLNVYRAITEEAEIRKDSLLLLSEALANFVVLFPNINLDSSPYYPDLGDTLESGIHQITLSPLSFTMDQQHSIIAHNTCLFLTEHGIARTEIDTAIRLAKTQPLKEPADKQAYEFDEVLLTSFVLHTDYVNRLKDPNWIEGNCKLALAFSVHLNSFNRNIDTNMFHFATVAAKGMLRCIVSMALLEHKGNAATCALKINHALHIVHSNNLSRYVTVFKTVLDTLQLRDINTLLANY